MSHCVECRFWESSDMDSSDGLAICLKLTTEAVLSAPNDGKTRKLCIIRTRGDHTCEFFKPMTVEQLMGGSA